MIKDAFLIKTNNGEKLRLLALIPHPEIRHTMRAWSAELFKAGIAGAWSFPHAAPLAVLSDFLSSEKLKECAALLAAHLPDGEKIKCGLPEFSVFPRGTSPSGLQIYGPELNLHIPDAAVSLLGAAALHWFSPLVLGAAMVTEADSGVTDEAVRRIQTPAPAFRAAALANVLFMPLPGEYSGGIYSYAWKIGSLHWLPPRRIAKNAQPATVSRMEH